MNEGVTVIKGGFAAHVFDGIAFGNKPDLTAEGLAPARVAYSTELWGGSGGTEVGMPNEQAVKHIARSVAPGVPLILDIEHWNVQTDPTALERTIDDLLEIVGWVRSANPEVEVGFFGLAPLANGYRELGYARRLDDPTLSSTPAFIQVYQELQALNGGMARLASAVDFLCPVLYTLKELSGPGDDYRQIWDVQAANAIHEAQKYGKPVFPFLWPQFYDEKIANGDNAAVPADFWRHQLEYIESLGADGAVIWGSPTYRSSQWNDLDPWWAATKAFLSAATTSRDDLLGDASADVITDTTGNDHLFGFAGDDVLTGGTGANLLSGAEGNDRLYGGQGRDSLEGGIGDDVLDGGEGVDTASYASAPASVVVSLLLQGVPQATGGAGADTLTNFENLTGSNFNDVLTGNARANVLNGGPGADTMIGGVSNDTYVVSSAGDTVIELPGQGTDTVLSIVSYTLPSDVENLKLTGARSISGFGNALNNILTGNSGDNLLDGNAGNDVLDGGGGVDTASYASAPAGVVVSLVRQGTSQDTGGAGADTLRNFENLTGSNFSDTLTGDANANVLNGGLRADTLAGGRGDDTYVVDNFQDTVVENPGEGTDTVRASSSYILPDNLENLQLTGKGSIDGTGNALNNALTGNSGGNVLDGKAGDDIMAGGLGDDTYHVDSAGDVVSESVGGGNDTVTTSVSFALNAGVEVELLRTYGSATTEPINLTGNEFSNTLAGNAAANRLNGGGGADSMSGALGDDTYFVDNAGDTVVESVAGGKDTVITSVSFVLSAGSEVELVRTYGSATTALINLTGNEFSNTLVGNAAANVLNGGGGADTLYGYSGADLFVFGADPSSDGFDTIDGGAHTDTASFAGFGSAVWVSLASVGREAWTRDGATVTSGTWREIADITNVENVVGSAFADELIGSTLANQLDGGGGNDKLDGGAGDDTLVWSAGFDTLNGGADTDTVSFADFGSAVWVSLASVGTEAWTRDTASVTSGTWRAIADITNVENAIGTAFADELIGNTLDNQLDGGTGNDKLDGDAGNDTLVWSGGFDTLNGGADTDTVSFAGFGSAVWVSLASVGTEALTRDTASMTSGTWRAIADITNVENAIGTAFADELFGDALANHLDGGAGNDRLDGGAGNDRLDGGDGNDTLVWSGGFDTLNGGAHIDTASFAGFGSAVWVNLAYVGSEAWTQDAATVTGGTWREIADITDVENVIGTNFADELFGDALANRLDGGAGNDKLHGGAGNDTLDGGAGNDTLVWSSGFDTMNGGADTDTASFAGFGSAVWVNLAYVGSEAWTQDAATVTGGTWREIADITNVENVIGTAFADGLFGDALANQLDGGAGNDRLDGAAGNDRLDGGAGNDTLVWSGGFDTLNGGAHIDTVSFAGSGSAVWVTLASVGTEAWTRDTASVTSGTWRAIADIINVENVTGSAFTDELLGDGLANQLEGGAGNDKLDGGAGNDTLDGGAGDDTLVWSGGFDSLNGGAHTDTVSFAGFGSAIWVSLASVGTEAWTRDTASMTSGTWRAIADITHVENAIGTAFADELIGNTLDNQLDGGTGNDKLDGGAGNDTLVWSGGFDTLNGGAHTDTVSFAGFGSAVWVNLAYEGSEAWTRDTATVASGTWREIADVTNVENVIGTGFADELFGNTVSNRLDGGAGNDRLDGGAGNDTLVWSGGFDTMDGGAHTDTVSFAGFGSAVWVSLAYEGSEAWTRDTATVASGTWREIADISNVENVIGTAFADELVGNALANQLEGGAGNDRLSGAAGADRFDYNNINHGVDTLPDFTRGSGNDVLDIRDVLVGYVQGSSTPSNFVQLFESGGNTTVRVNADGIGGDFVDVAILQGHTGVLLNDMIAQGNLALS